MTLKPGRHKTIAKVILRPGLSGLLEPSLQNANLNNMYLSIIRPDLNHLKFNAAVTFTQKQEVSYWMWYLWQTDEWILPEKGRRIFQHWKD